jgi:O-antigen ligase
MGTLRASQAKSIFLSLGVMAVSVALGGLIALQPGLGVAAGGCVLVVLFALTTMSRAPLMLTALIPAFLLGLVLPQSAEIALEICMISIAAYWALKSFDNLEPSGAAIAALCVPLLWALLLFNSNVPDLHTGLLGLRKATLIFVGLALGLLWPRGTRQLAARVLPIMLLVAGVVNLIVYLLFPAFEQSFVRQGGVYTGLFHGIPRMQGIYSGPFHIALLGVFLGLYGWQRIIAGNVWRSAPFIVVGLSLVYFSEVRSAYLVIFAGVVILGVFGGPVRRGKWTRIGGQLALVGCGIALILSFGSSSDAALSSISNLGNEQRSLSRLTKWSEAGTLISESPIYGWGPGSGASVLDKSFENHKYVTSHDSLLTYLVEGGIIGLALVLLTGILTVRSSPNWLRTSHPGAIAAIALIGMSISNNIEEAAPICVVLAIIVGLRRELPRDRSSSTSLEVASVSSSYS